MLNPVKATLDYLRGADLKVRLPAPEEKQYATSVPPFWPGVPPQPGPGMYQRFLPNTPATWVPGTESYGNVANSAVFACLDTIATSYIEPRLGVYRRDAEGQAERLPRHRMQGLLDRPNPYHSRPELWWWVAFAKHTDGNAFLRKVRTGGGNVEELWPLSPTRVEVVTTDADQRAGVFISYYRYETRPGRYEDLDPLDVVHFRLGLDDRDHRLGCGPLKWLLREIATDDEITAFMLSLLGNYAVPGLVVTTPDRTMTREQAEAIKDSVSERFSGDNRGRVGVLNNGATVAQFGWSPEQLDMKLLHRVPEERIAAVMGVPAIVAGLGAGLDRSTYANARESREIFTEQKLCPLWVFDAASVDLQLLPDFDADPQTFTQFDLTDVRALQEDEDKKYARLQLGVQGKWITVNEARQDVGLPPVDGGDELPVSTPTPPQLAPFTGGPPDRQPPPQLPPPAAAGQQAAFSGGEPRAERKAIGLQLTPALMDAMISLAMPAFQRDLEALWEGQRARVLQAVIREG
jgi:HK97 family phage portal protein